MKLPDASMAKKIAADEVAIENRLPVVFSVSIPKMAVPMLVVETVRALATAVGVTSLAPVDEATVKIVVVALFVAPVE